MRKTVLALSLASLSSACALLQKAEPVEPVYLTPDAPVRTQAPSESSRSDLAVRLRRVRGSRHLGERVVVRDAQHAVRFLEQTRWTDPPRSVVEGRLAEALFEDRGLTRVVGGAGPTLEVTVRSFELVDGDPPLARVELTCLLHDERRSLFQTTLTFEEPTAVERDGDDVLVGPRFAAAMGRALDAAAEAIALRVERTLSEQVAAKSE